MGEGMSKRLKVQLGREAEMEERAFNNPYPDYQPHGSTASASITLPTPNDSDDNRLMFSCLSHFIRLVENIMG
uniref:Uncharacterized protein n=1 Tax=Laticauda laticaudata TaxID=8630 RepID=A0A8C5SKQ1_LATLA